MTVTESAADETDALTLILAGVERLQTTIRNYKVLFAVFAVAVMVLGSGWWSSAHDHSATKHNGDVADCRSVAQALRLDDFSIIVSPDATQDQRDAAADRISTGPSLVASYKACG